MFSGPRQRLLIIIAAWSAALGGRTVATRAQDAKPEPGSSVQGVPGASDDLVRAARKVREGRFEEALAEIKRESTKHGDWSPPRLLLARLMLSAGQAQPGRLALERAAIETPDHPEIYLTLGTLALGDGRFSDARLNFEHTLKLLASQSEGDEKLKNYRREAHAGLAAAGEAREDWASSQRHLYALLEIDPKNGQARQRLGRVFFRLGKVDEAYKTLIQACKDNPALEPPAVSMGWLFSQSGDPKKAEEWFEFAQKADPGSARARMAYAAWLLDQGRVPKARTEIDESVKLDPTLKEAQRLRGLIAWHMRDLVGVEKILEPLHHDTPADSTVANLLALALLDQEDAAKRKRGQELAELNVVQFPRSHEVLATLGWAYFRAGRIDEAVQKLRAAVHQVRTTPDIAYYLARVLAEKGQPDDAMRLLQSATKLPGAFAHRSEADALLKSLAQEKPKQP
jgi:tetratricopeptide (TPR) repeat protein